jgi:hypothetical protein
VVTVCESSGCATLTIGKLCLSCEPELGARPRRSFVRGRPYERATGTTPEASIGVVDADSVGDDGRGLPGAATR